MQPKEPLPSALTTVKVPLGAGLKAVEAAMGATAQMLTLLRKTGELALEEAEKRRDGRAIVRASLALGRIYAAHAALTEGGVREELGAPPPQRRPRARHNTTHTRKGTP